MGQMINRRRVMGREPQYSIKLVMVNGDIIYNTDTSLTSLVDSDIPSKANSYNSVRKVFFGDNITAFNFSNNGNCALARSIPTLDEVVLPKNIQIIGAAPFLIGDVVLPDSVTTIGGRPFANNRLTSLYIPKNVTQCGNNNDRVYPVLAACPNVTNVTVDPDNETYRSENGAIIIKSTDAITSACKSCTNIPNGIKRLLTYAYGGTTVPYIVFPQSITNISFMLAIIQQYVIINASTIPSVHNRAFDGTYPIYVPDDMLNSYKSSSAYQAWVDRIFPLSQFETDRITNNWD